MLQLNFYLQCFKKGEDAVTQKRLNLPQFMSTLLTPSYVAAFFHTQFPSSAWALFYFYGRNIEFWSAFFRLGLETTVMVFIQNLLVHYPAYKLDKILFLPDFFPGIFRISLNTRRFFNFQSKNIINLSGFLSLQIRFFTIKICSK